MEGKHQQINYSGAYNGFVMLFVILLALIVSIALFVIGVEEVLGDEESVCMVVGAGVLFVSALFCLKGLFLLEPNQSVVLIFFGKYRGTAANTGFFWVNPFMSKHRISLRINNLDVEPIKVNDKVGNPIMIGLVLVWKADDTYKVVFDLNGSTGELGQTSWTQISNFVAVQSDAALREVAGKYPYDSDGNEDIMTLRSGGEEINEELERKLNERLSMAGIEVVEARINYLAYAPEIAAVMLRRQQATAIISAREKIVEGAVSMVKMALNQLETENVVKLAEEHKAQLVGNLLVVLCADEAATPVVNAGS